MKKFFACLSFVALQLSSMASADPINDLAFNSYKAGWFPSLQTPCAKVCAAEGARAEFELFAGPGWQNTATFVCKGETQVGGVWGGSGWLYGNNFNSPSRENVCMVSTAAGGAQRLLKFYCLCVVAE